MNESTAVAKTETKAAERRSKLRPVFVEAEKMFEKMTEITKETAARAYEFFRERGGEFGKEIEDWLRAEREILRPVAIELKETDEKITIKATVPGFKPEEIEVSIEDRNLLISGKTETELKTEEENVLMKEWKSNRIFRQVRLPVPVNAENVEAHLKDGILELTLPKTEKKDATKINVAAG